MCDCHRQSGILTRCAEHHPKGEGLFCSTDCNLRIKHKLVQSFEGFPDSLQGASQVHPQVVVAMESAAVLNGDAHIQAAFRISSMVFPVRSHQPVQSMNSI